MLLTYLAVGAVVVLVLYFAWRSLATSPDVAPADYRVLLLRLADSAILKSAEIGDALSSRDLLGRDAGPAVGGAEAQGAGLTEVASAARKHIGGCLQQVSRIEPADLGEDASGLADARALLTTGMEDLAWACRLVEAGSWPVNTGIRGAVSVLREHGDACLDRARSLLADPVTEAAGEVS